MCPDHKLLALYTLVSPEIRIIDLNLLFWLRYLASHDILFLLR